MELSTLKEMLGKTLEARFTQKGSDLNHDREAIQPQAGLRLGWDRPVGLSAGFEALNRH